MSGWQRQRDHGKCDTRVPLTGRDGRCWQSACQPPLGAWHADRRTGALPLWRNKLLRLEVNACNRHARADESFCLSRWAGGWGRILGWEEEQCRPVHNSCSYIDKESNDEQSEADSLLLQRWHSWTFASCYTWGRHQLSELKLGWKCEMAAKPVCVAKTVLEYQVCTWRQPLNPPIWSPFCRYRGSMARCCDHGMFGKWASIDKPCACLMF